MAAEEAPLARAFCSSPAFKKLSCKVNGLMQSPEVVSPTGCFPCGVRYMPVSTRLPATIRPIGSSTFAWARISLACKGPILVRSVFKPLTVSDYWRRFGKRTPDCSAFTLSPYSDDGRPNSPTIRCELELPRGPGSEKERVLRAKETNCHVCGDCGAKPPVKCPWTVGKWYSDTFTTVAEGCDLNPKGYYAHTVGFNMSPGVDVRLAKFEVCEPGSCFNPAKEAAKQKAARKCTLPPRETGRTDWQCN